jgi:hypothetical protein
MRRSFFGFAKSKAIPRPISYKLWSVADMENERIDSFGNPKLIDDLAKAQGIHGAQSVETLTGAAPDLWESDEAFERFMESIVMTAN